MEKMPGKVWSKRPCVIKMTKFNGRKMFVHFPECLLTGFRLCVIFNKKIQKICSEPPFLCEAVFVFLDLLLVHRGPSVPFFVPSIWYKTPVVGNLLATGRRALRRLVLRWQWTPSSRIS